jgi:hypothetical protein
MTATTGSAVPASAGTGGAPRVTIRRIFITDHIDLVKHPEIRRIMDQQHKLGIQVRILDTTRLSSIAGGFVPMVIFDGSVLYEHTSTWLSNLPGYTKTTLILQPQQVDAMVDRFNQVWSIQPS